MTQPFVPLAPGVLPTTLPTSTRLKPISVTPSTFEPSNPSKPKPEPTVSTHTSHTPPKITLERQGETITHIRVECGCGQVTEIKCEY
jgi:hypothetical protein